MLSLWEKKDFVGVLNYINGVRFEPSAQMLEGQKYDAEACESGTKNGKLTEEFGGFKLRNPKPQLKLESEMTDSKGREFTLVGVLDTYDDGDIWEFKTGVMSSIRYAGTKQTRIYYLLCLLNNLPVNAIRITRYDQYDDSNDIHIVIPSNSMASNTKKYLIKTVTDIYDWLENVKEYDEKK